MRAITGTIVSSRPCALRKTAKILSRFSDSAATHLPASDCATYVAVAAAAAADQHNFICALGANLNPHGYEGLVEGRRKHQGGSMDEVAEVAVEQKKSKRRKKEEEIHEDKADAGVDSHIPASPEILSEHRKKKQKHSSKELLSVVKQEPNLLVEEDGGSERKKKKKEKHSDNEVASILKQESGFVMEELRTEKKGKKKKEKGNVKLEEDVVEVKGQILNNGAVEQVLAEVKKKKKKHSEEEGDSKGIKEDKMASDGDLSSEKNNKKKRGRGDADDVQEQGEYKKKKQRTPES